MEENLPLDMLIFCMMQNICIYVSKLSKETNHNVREDVEKGEPLYTVGGNADWCSHCRKQYGVTSKN